MWAWLPKLVTTTALASLAVGGSLSTGARPGAASNVTAVLTPPEAISIVCLPQASASLVNWPYCSSQGCWSSSLTLPETRSLAMRKLCGTSTTGGGGGTGFNVKSTADCDPRLTTTEVLAGKKPSFSAAT